MDEKSTPCPFPEWKIPKRFFFPSCHFRPDFFALFAGPKIDQKVSFPAKKEVQTPSDRFDN
jgi:hypothetical protein